jgi:curved DNA-binding protein CbpA
VTHYDVLGVSRNAPISEVRQAYVALAREHHPDRSGGDADAMRAVNEAWATLRDPDRRASYDLTLHAVPPAPVRPAAEPRERTDREELLADLEDDTPLGGRVVLPKWLSLVPVATFAASVGMVGLGMLFGSTAALSLAFMLFALSCALFLMAPFVALLASRRGR